MAINSTRKDGAGKTECAESKGKGSFPVALQRRACGEGDLPAKMPTRRPEPSTH